MTDTELNAKTAEHIFGWKWENRPAGIGLISPDGTKQYFPTIAETAECLPKASDEDIMALEIVGAIPPSETP
jgi:hypothetical protein